MPVRVFFFLFLSGQQRLCDPVPTENMCKIVIFSTRHKTGTTPKCGGTQYHLQGNTRTTLYYDIPITAEAVIVTRGRRPDQPSCHIGSPLTRYERRINNKIIICILCVFMRDLHTNVRRQQENPSYMCIVIYFVVFLQKLETTI